MKNIFFTVVALFAIIQQGFTQGPPLLADKPILIGGNRLILRPQYQFANSDFGNLSKYIVRAKYNWNSKFQLGGVLPAYSYNSGKFELGDVKIFAKYNVYANDKKGSSFRIAGKIAQTFGVGSLKWNPFMQFGEQQTAIMAVAGLENNKIGVFSELGYMFVNNHEDLLHYKLSFGIPLMEIQYPSNQVNILFEFEGRSNLNSYNAIIFAPGIQRAFKRLTLEANVQYPLTGKFTVNQNFNYIYTFGSRYIF